MSLASDPPSPKVRTELDGEVFTITLADPENRNVLSLALVDEFIAAIDRAEADPEVRVVVVSNDGAVFCAGADLSERATNAVRGGAPDSALIFARIRNSPKPFVGRIAGHAVGGGLGLAASMDISVAVEAAKFGFTEVRVGVAPAIISVICLPKMRQADAAEAFLRGNRFLAPEAVRLGLINYAVPQLRLDEAIAEIVADLLEGSPAGLAASKQLITKVPSLDFDAALEWTGELSAHLFTGPDATEGMRAFLGKRPPSWSPRS
ncbi:MAG: enoyl-CoA hydratase-related protein [Acidimicrobiales bacterium]